MADETQAIELIEEAKRLRLRNRELEAELAEYWRVSQVSHHFRESVAGEGLIAACLQRCAAFEESERRYHNLYENMNEGVALHEMLYDDDGHPVDYRFLEVNGAFERLTGLRRETIIGQRITEILPGIEQDTTDWIGVYGKVVQTGRPIRFERFSQALDRWFCISAFSSGSNRFVAVFLDITDRRHVQEKADQAKDALLRQQRQEKKRVNEELNSVRDELVRATRLAAIGQVSAYIAHDLRNPLGAVQNAVYLLKYYLPDAPENLTRQFETIDRELKRSNQIITNLLNLARAKRPEKRETSLQALVRQAVSDMRLPRCIDWQVISEPDPFMVYADPALLRQTIGNLLDNAVEAMQSSGRFVIEARVEGAEQVIRFRDSGPGFSAEIRGDALDPLITTKTGGTGLGLTICRDIITQHDGTLVIEQHSGPGAVIRITLPQAR